MLRCYVSQTLQRVRKRNCGALQPMRSAAGAFALGASQLPPAPLRRIAASTPQLYCDAMPGEAPAPRAHSRARAPVQCDTLVEISRPTVPATPIIRRG